MGRYISLPLETDPLEREPHDGNLDAWLIQTSARLAAELRAFAKDVPEEIFRYFGQEVLQVYPKLSTFASFVSTWTAIDTNGYLLPAGTLVGVKRPDGELAAFQVAMDYSITPGLSSVADVTLIAVDSGAESSGLSTDVDQIKVIDALPWVESVVGDAPTSGGTDGETTDEYMDRLVDEIRLMSPRPILPVDFSVLARRIEGVDRAYFLNLYDADTNTAGVEKAITIVVTDPDGEAVSSDTMNEVDALLQSMREVNMLIYVRAPQYQNVMIAYEVTALPEVDTVSLKIDIDVALEEYVSPKRWGEMQFGTEGGGYWRPVNVVRYLEVATVINNVVGVDYIDALTIDAGTVDVTLDPGAGVPVVLPRVVTPIVGVVNAAD
jgi:hypothetical protein